MIRLLALPPLLLAAALCAAHPFAAAWLAVGLAALAALLWRYPHAWLVAIPALLPVLNLSPWTGWLLVAEMDAVLLVAIGVLILRDPPSRADIRLDPAARWTVLAFLAATMLGLALGLLRPEPQPATVNILLSPWNALRVAKAALFALALAPFLWRRQRLAGDAPAMFGHGVLLGLVALSALVVLERLAFTGLWSFASEYRVSASFASMHVGGGHIGAYLAMALPFLLVPIVAPRRLSAPLVLLAGAGGAYALVVTFARTAYAAALLGLGIAAAGLLIASWRTRAMPRTGPRPESPSGPPMGSPTGSPTGHAPRRVLPALAGTAALAAIGLVIALSARDGGFMSSRLTHLAPDYADRARNWTAGLALRDDDALAWLAGMGTGTYPRTAFTRAPDRTGPSNLSLAQEGGFPVLRITSRGPFYFGQKIAAAPGDALRVALRVRAPSVPVGVSFGLCEKWLLYSEACATASHRAVGGGAWETVTLNLAVPGTSRPVPRPLEFWINIPPRATLDIADASLTAADGRTLLRNQDFRAGTTHWLFTDDGHGSWRIFNQYFTGFFEGGALGLAAFAALLTLAGLRAAEAAWHGDRTAPAFLGALAAFTVSCLFDAQLEATAVALLFYLVALAVPSPRLTGPRAPLPT